eukprot:402030_1
MMFLGMDLLVGITLPLINVVLIVIYCDRNIHCNSYSYTINISRCVLYPNTNPNNDYSAAGPQIFCQTVTCPIGIQIGSLTHNNDVFGNGLVGWYNTTINQCGIDCDRNILCNSYSYYCDRNIHCNSYSYTINISSDKFRRMCIISKYRCVLYPNTNPNNDYSAAGPQIFCQ